MGKNRKREKSLLNKFKDYTDDRLLTLLKNGIQEYKILVKSEQLAIQILTRYGISVGPTLNQIQKQRVETLLKVAKLRNLTIPEEWHLVEISKDDVISRIEQFKHQEISWIEEHNYLFDLVDTNLELNSSSCKQSSEEAIEDVHNKYDRIIEEQKKKMWNPDLWKPLGIKPVEVKDYIKPGESTGGFIPYQAPNDRYEVRGIMPSAETWYQEDLKEMTRKLSLSKNENE